MVKFLSKSDNFLAKFLNFLKGPSVEYLILLFFELAKEPEKKKKLSTNSNNIEGDLIDNIELEEPDQDRGRWRCDRARSLGSARMAFLLCF